MITKKDIDVKYQDITIHDPEINYIFTLNLNGRLDGISEKLQDTNYDNLFCDESKVNIRESIKKVYPLEMSDSFVGYYVESSFVEAVTPIRWIFSCALQNSIIEKSIELFKSSVKCNNCTKNNGCFEYLNFHTKLIQNFSDDNTECINLVNICGTQFCHVISGIEVKLFAQGAFSILLRFNCGSDISLYDYISDIRYPENITMMEECYLGPLNKFASIVAKEALLILLESPAFLNFHTILTESFTSFDERLNFEKAIKVKANFFEKEVDPYVSLVCSGLSEASSKNKFNLFGNNPDSAKAQTMLIAIANNTPEFLEYFNNPKKYMNDNNLARGKEILLIERRGWIMVSPRLNDLSERDRFRRGFVNSLIYSIESISATTKTIESFNENLETVAKKVSHEFNFQVTNFYSNKKNVISSLVEKGKLSKNIKIFVSVIAKARSISPCEDISTSMEAHVRSPTLIKAINKLKSFGMIELITLARMRMKNYGYFLQTGHQIIMEEKRKTQNLLMIIFTFILLILTVITGFNLL